MMKSPLVTAPAPRESRVHTGYVGAAVLLSLLSAGVGAAIAITAAYSSGPSPSDMISGKTGFMAYTTLWEYGPEEAWRQVVTPDLVFEIPKMGIRRVGPDAAWTFRKLLSSVLPNGTLIAPFSQSTLFGQMIWTNTYGSHYVDPHNAPILYSDMVSFLRYVPGPAGNPYGPAGKTMQVGKWTTVFAPDGRIASMHQDVIFASYWNQSDPAQANPCSASPAPTTVCVTNATRP